MQIFLKGYLEIMVMNFFLRRVARESGFLRPERQSSDSCQSQSDCLATPIVNVTVDFVDCVGGEKLYLQAVVGLDR